jgi:electron transfer flavoprotein alpha subunit
MARNILVVAELVEGALSPTTAELIGQGTRLADGGSVAVTLLGSGAGGAGSAAFEAGADRVFSSDDAGYDQYNSDQWIAAVTAAAEQHTPEAIFVAQSTVGRDLGPRLAARLNTAVAMDCVNVADDGGALKATRPCYGGNAQATYGFATSPAIATIRAKSFDPIEPRAGASGETVALPALADSRTTIVGRELAEAAGLQITEAPIVVSGGRGLGGPEGFELVEALAAAFGSNRAAVGASRAACDLGWYPVSQQVGLTGKVVTPDLYVAIAISGASQHMAGCSGSKMIIAINRDPEANIFQNAKYGIVGDYKAVLPPLIEAVKAAG